MKDWLVRNCYGYGAGRVLCPEPGAVFEQDPSNAAWVQRGIELALVSLILGGLLSIALPFRGEEPRQWHEQTQIHLLHPSTTLQPKVTKPSSSERIPPGPKTLGPPPESSVPIAKTGSVGPPVHEQEVQDESRSGEGSEPTMPETTPDRSALQPIIANLAPLPAPPLPGKSELSIGYAAVARIPAASEAFSRRASRPTIDSPDAPTSAPETHGGDSEPPGSGSRTATPGVSSGSPIPSRQAPAAIAPLGPPETPNTGTTSTQRSALSASGTTISASLQATSSAPDGVPLDAFPSCSPRAREERLKKRIIAAAPTPRECSNETGSYYFVETKNLNAFLLWIDSGAASLENGSDACDQLTLALRCIGIEIPEESSL